MTSRVMAMAIILILVMPVAAGAQDLADRLAVGFQITSHFTGFSFKYQLDEARTFQPIIYLKAEGDELNKTMDGTMAVRLLYDMGTNGSYRQYLGWGLGLNYHKKHQGGTLVENQTNYGVQGFIGLETARPDSPMSTNVELSLGLSEDGDELGSGTFKAGFGLGLGVHYHF